VVAWQPESGIECIAESSGSAAINPPSTNEKWLRCWLSRMLAKHGPGRRGVGRLRALIDEYRQGDEVPDSVLESLGVELARATGHKPQLHWNVLDGARHVAEVDLAWPEVRLCVEFDGWKTHGSRAAFVRDRARDRALFPLGWTVLRYTWDDVVRDRDNVLDQLVQSYESRARSFPPAPSRRSHRR
jgi:REase_MTES_1575